MKSLGEIFNSHHLQSVGFKHLSIKDISEALIPLPGRDYLSYLAEFVKSANATNYFEIGTNFGDSLAPIECQSIAIDPEFKLNRDVMGNKPSCLLYQTTSDDFFDNFSPSAILNSKIDIAFLDGMHLFEYLLRDFINTEKYCSKNSIIVLHDCLPPTYEMTNRDFIAAKLNKDYLNYWTGDVWKLSSILKEYRQDLKIIYNDCPPSGLVFITDLDPESSILSENYEEIVQDYSEKEADLDLLKEHLNSVDVVKSQDTDPESVLLMLREK